LAREAEFSFAPPPPEKYHDVYQIIGFSWFDLHFPLVSGIYKLHQIKASFPTFQLSPCLISFIHLTLTTKICKKTEFILSNIKNSFTLRGKR